MMLFRPAGLIPERRHKVELRGGRARHAVLRRPDRGRHDRPRPDGRLMAGPTTCSSRRRSARSSAGWSRSTTSTSSIPRGSIVGLIGPERRRQDDVLQQLTGVYKPTSGSIVFEGTEVVDGLPPHAITALGIGADVPEHPPVRADERDRERARRHALPPARRASSARSCGPRRVKREEAASRATARESCSSRRACRGATTSAPATCRTATSAASRSRARWRPSRSCCCSTSRPPG